MNIKEVTMIQEVHHFPLLMDLEWDMLCSAVFSRIRLRLVSTRALRAKLRASAKFWLAMDIRFRSVPRAHPTPPGIIATGVRADQRMSGLLSLHVFLTLKLNCILEAKA